MKAFACFPVQEVSFRGKSTNKGLRAPILFFYLS